jgi:hypothetical protein
VASLLAVRWHRIFDGLHCYAFAPPATMSRDLSAKTKAYITALVYGDDAVPRWSLGSTKDVCLAAVTLAKERGASSRILRIALIGVRGGGMEGGGKHDESGGGREGGDPPEEGGQGADGGGVGGGGAKRDERGREEEEAISDSVWCQSILSALEAEMQEDSILISPLYCDFYIVNILGC